MKNGDESEGPAADLVADSMLAATNGIGDMLASGIVGTDDKPLFPNAQYYITQSDFEFWTDEGKLGSPLKDFVVHARKNLLPVRDRIVFIKDGQEFLPGVQAIAAPGHTVGHTIFTVTSAGKSFAFLGDLTHHAVLLLEKPRMEFSYDTDPKQAAGTRVKLLDTIAAMVSDAINGEVATRSIGSARRRNRTTIRRSRRPGTGAGRLENTSRLAPIPGIELAAAR